MSRTTLRNIAIVGAVALAVVALPGGGQAAEGVLAVISLAFMAAIAWFGIRLYRENQFTIWSLETTHRVLLYGAIALAFATMVATPRLWQSGAGTLAWFALLAAAAGAVFYVWNESRRYRV